jgi:hypothetical protein
MVKQSWSGSNNIEKKNPSYLRSGILSIQLGAKRKIKKG